MHIKDRTAKLSQLRQALQGCLTDMKRSLGVTFGRAPMVKGNVYELARRCGKPACSCATKGALHRSMVLSFSHEGKTKLFSIPPPQTNQADDEALA